MKKNVIVYGGFCGVNKRAVEILTHTIFDYAHEVPDCISSESVSFDDNTRYFFIGTKKDNTYINDNFDTELSHDEEYAIKVCDGNVYICGSDENGVLYGCIDFYSKYILPREYVKMVDCRTVNVFESDFEDFECVSHPSVKNRGIWTWGHVMYDYRKFLENMMRLKMNTIIIWNDYVPTNAKDVVEYAHSCGIKVIWGFSWLWAVNCAEIDIRHVNEKAPEIVEKFEREYAHLNADGLYFQSFTELQRDSIDGVLIADAVTGFVNKTSALFMEKYPELELQFGLHASSVKEKLQYIKNVNKDVRIVWEDAGSAPYSYIVDDMDDFDKTAELTKKIALLRGNDDKFGVVLKGFTKLDWSSFKHMTNSQCIGTASEVMQRERVMEKSKIWKYVQANWIVHAPKVYEMIQLMSNLKGGELDITALVEDGMFEKKIYYPVAVYAEMLWNTDADIKEIMSNTAMRSYVDFE